LLQKSKAGAADRRGHDPNCNAIVPLAIGRLNSPRSYVQRPERVAARIEGKRGTVNAPADRSTRIDRAQRKLLFLPLQGARRDVEHEGVAIAWKDDPQRRGFIARS